MVHRHFIAGLLTLMLFSLPFYLQIIQATELLQRQHYYSFLYLWHDPHELTEHVSRSYFLTVLLFRIILVPTILSVGVLAIFGFYVALDFFQEHICRRAIKLHETASEKYIKKNDQLLKRKVFYKRKVKSY